MLSTVSGRAVHLASSAFTGKILGEIMLLINGTFESIFFDKIGYNERKPVD